MKLTYRGIKYKAQQQEAESSMSNSFISLNRCFAGDMEDNKVIQIKPIHYFTYRGVSYTKNLFFDSGTKLLIDIDRK